MNFYSSQHEQILRVGIHTVRIQLIYLKENKPNWIGRIVLLIFY